MPSFTNISSTGSSTTVDYTAQLNDILAAIGNVDANTDGVEANLTQLIADTQAGNVTLANILTESQAIGATLADIDANTDDVENLIQSLNASIIAEFDQQQLLFNTMVAELQAMNAKLNEDCTGDPIKVEVCNQVDLSGLQSSLDNILSEIQSINANTDGVESSLADLITEVQAGNVNLGDIESLLNNVLTQLQGLDVNTDDVETLVQTLINTVVSEGDQTQALLTTANATLTSILAKLGEDCSGDPIKVEVCNPVDVSGLQTSLNTIITELQGIDDNTDMLEDDLQIVITEIQSGNVDLSAISTTLSNSLTELQAINVNTDSVEALITSTQTVIQNELDATQALLQTEFDQQQVQFASMVTELVAMNAKLNETCGGSPLLVQVCNPVDMSAVETSLGNILTQVTSVNANTDGVEASFTQLISDVQTGNAGLNDIEAVLNSSLTELQSIDENTDNVESLIGTLTSVVTTEGDQTQTLLTSIDSRLSSVETIMAAACGSGNEQNVNVCNAITTDIDLTTVETNTGTTATNVSAVNTTLGTTNSTLNAIRTVLTAACGSGNEQNVSICGTVDVNTSLDLSVIETNTEETNTQLQAVNNELDALSGNVTGLNSTADDIRTRLEAIDQKIGAECGSGDEQNVQVCPKTSITVGSVDTNAIGSIGSPQTLTIPAGFRHGSILVKTGTARVNGVPYDSLQGLHLPPMSYGLQELLYDEYPITDITGEVVVNYHV